jgi:hypothetical protein
MDKQDREIVRGIKVIDAAKGMTATHKAAARMLVLCRSYLLELSGKLNKPIKELSTEDFIKYVRGETP